MCLKATPSREVPQTLASTTSKQGLNREVWAALLRVRTRPECPEGNLRELMWDKQYVIHELPDVQAGFRKGRGTRDQIANIHWIIEKGRVPEKHLFLLYCLCPKPLTVWITINCGKSWKRWEYQTTWPASWETCMQVRKQQLELDMEQQTGSK